VVRTTVEALAAVLGGTSSLHTNALDETLALPTAASAEIALRTQQVLAEETGVVNVADPLGGSWYVEALTDRLEAEAEETFARIEKMGADESGPGSPHPIGPITAGLLRGVETGWFSGEIADSAFAWQRRLEQGERRVVGVNAYTETVGSPVEVLRISPEVEAEQRRVLARRRADRDDAAVRAALADLRAALPGSTNLVEPMLAAARAEATLGEICGVLREEWGGYVETTRW
jgi:methylmalonyl-CoA mutase N-terminal domain/subunit